MLWLVYQIILALTYPFWPSRSKDILLQTRRKWLLKAILLEISFIEEMRTTWGNKDVPQTFFHYFLYSQKYNLFRLTPYHWQLCISQFCDNKGNFGKRFGAPLYYFRSVLSLRRGKGGKGSRAPPNNCLCLPVSVYSKYSKLLKSQNTFTQNDK